MLTLIHPNSEIEIISSLRIRTERRDSNRPSPRLDIKLPVPTKKISRLKSGLVAGFGRLHRGVGKFRRGTSRRVTRLGGAIDSYSKETGDVRVFITLTCPGSSKRAVEAFSAWSGYLLNGLNDWVQRRQERSTGRKGVLRLHVWELQKRGAEHLHYCVCVSRAVFESLQEDLRSWFYARLRKISELASVDIFERKNGGGSWRNAPDVLQLKIEEVKNSVSAYLSKYLGKGLTGPGQGFASSSTPRPARLWGATRCLKRRLRAVTTSDSWSLTSQGEVESVCAIQDLAQTKSLKYSCHTYHGGLTTRIRLFFCGDDLELSSFYSELGTIVAAHLRTEVREDAKVMPMIGLFRKAVRIREKQANIVAFSEIYGENMAKSLTQWVTEVPFDKFQKSMLLTCLEDFDDVLLSSKQKIARSAKRKGVTTQQLTLDLFRPGTR